MQTAYANALEPVKSGLPKPLLIRLSELGETATPCQIGFIVDRSEKQIREWCKSYGIGRKIGGRWLVDIGLLKAFLESEGA